MPADRNTDDARDLFDRGHAALDAGEVAEAVECFTRAVRLRPDVAAVYRARAAAFLRMNDRTRALADFDHAIRLKPDDTQTYADRAAVLFAQKAYDRAVADCNRVLADDPGRADVSVLRGRCHAARGDTTSALKDFADAIGGDPENAPRVLLLRARLHLDCENFPAALADCDESIRREAESSDAHYTRGMVLHASGDAAGAVESFTAAVRLAPGYAFAWLGRAACHALRGDHAAVIDDCDAVLELAPNLGRAYELRGAAKQALEELDGALADFDAAVRFAPSAVLPRHYRASVHSARGEHAAAIRDYLEALKRDPRHAATFNQLAWVWATCPDESLRNGERAKECATRACELTDWAEPGYLDTLAAAHAACGELADAVKVQQRATELADTPEYRARLEEYRARSVS
ncbi:MAG TPA: tetratricopeptide repeat protein [Gemmataceae bacterium]|nr:tetratricopeptide repeat protein [Gemmataceae bacterium]